MSMDSDHQSIRVVAMRTAQIAEGLARSEHHDGVAVTRELVPRERGVYIWRYKDTDEPAYVGRAVGRDGLRQRIMRQHLQPGYTKSVFRKAILSDAGGDPKQGSVDFIRATFSLSFLACPEDRPAVVLAAEALLIAALRPKCNKVRGELPTMQST
jgi:hypothetical protein